MHLKFKEFKNMTMTRHINNQPLEIVVHLLSKGKVQDSLLTFQFQITKWKFRGYVEQNNCIFFINLVPKISSKLNINQQEIINFLKSNLPSKLSILAS